jgi:hypothetical protein
MPITPTLLQMTSCSLHGKLFLLGKKIRLPFLSIELFFLVADGKSRQTQRAMPGLRVTGATQTAMGRTGAFVQKKRNQNWGQAFAHGT